ncbi:MAG TPA: phage holin family protein [Chloroflexota bacterium]|nr:phage holin family protein [Chloroflexota bacterium]
MEQSKDTRSLGELFADLSRETTTLVRQEIHLAKTEMTHKAASVGKDVGFLAVGGAVIYAGFLAIVAAVIIVLAHWIPWWLSALIVGGVIAGVGYGLVQKGLSALQHEDLAPRETVQTVKENVEWAKEQTR